MNSTRRPAAPLAPWSDIDGVVGGRDLQASGAWFAVDARQRVGIVTNFREFGRRRRSAPSRGGLIPGYLAGATARRENICSALETDAPGFAGFNLLLADRGFALVRLQSRRPVRARAAAGHLRPLQRIPRYSLAEARACAGTLRRAAAVDQGVATSMRFDSGLFEMLADRETAPPDVLPPGDLSPEWARKLSAPFVLDPGYGTRCSTVLTISNAGALRIAERRFDADGAAAGQSEHVLNDTDER